MEADITEVEAPGIKSSVLLFSGQGLKFIDEGTGSTTGNNKHDYAKGIDVKIKDGFIKNGADNYFPYHILNAVKRSTIQKRAFKTITSVAAGEITFVNPDGTAPKESVIAEHTATYKALGLTVRKFLKPAICAAYLFGGVPATMSWESNGREFVLSAVKDRDYKTFRLSIPVMKEGEILHDKHYYHRNWGWREDSKNRKVGVSKKVQNWQQWQKDQKKNADNVCYMYSYDKDRSLAKAVNRTQSFYIRDLDGLSDYYALPTWFTGAAFNYIQADFLLSCFDVDEIKNGFNASGIVEVYHKSYKNPESGEAKDTFEKHKKQVAEKLTGGFKSGAVTIVPVGIDGQPINDYMKFIPTPTTADKHRHGILGERINTNILSANGAIFSELFGIRNEKNVLSEGATKLEVGLRLLNEFTIKPLKDMFDSKDGGFLNMVNDILGIEERALIVPNLSAFLSIPEAAALHFLHPDQWFAMYKDFGMKPPTEEQIASNLIPAYRTPKEGTQVTVNNN